MTVQPDLDQYRHEALVANTAQGVRNYLIEMNNNRVNMRARWIWELLQNARDASTDSLVSVVKHSGNEVSFTHNGSEFEYEQISHLIYHGSTKVDDEGTLGRYGSGFLTTHLLSPRIDVSGRIKNGHSFEFTLVREIASPQSLSDSMNNAWDDFKASLAEIDSQGDSTTHFRYPIDEDSTDAVEDGIAALQRCAPLVLTFNQQFRQIDIESLGDSFSFEVSDRSELSSKGLHQVKVVTSENGYQTANDYILAQSEDEQTSVAVLLCETDDGNVCLPIDKTPRLYLGFPLVGTEGFSFPGIINGFGFTPMENRDGVYLGQADNEANATNQATIERACDLLVKIIQFTASSKCRDTHALAEIPSIPERTWIDEDWFRDCLIKHLIEPIRQTAAVLCEFGSDAIMPEEAILPFAENDIAVEALWDLLSDVEEFRHKLPRREESVGWCRAVRTWANIHACQPTAFDEVVDGRKLAAKVSEQCSDLAALKGLLREETCGVEWLNQLLACLKDNEFGDEIRNRRLVLDQAGYLDEISNLYLDKGVDDVLKDIADDLDLQMREYLRDNRLTSLVNETGAGTKENDDVVREIIDRLKELAGENTLNDEFTKASASLFGWIVSKEQRDNLKGFPAFSETKRGDDVVRETIWLGQIGQDDANMPLAPVKAWPEDLQPFADLFPPSRLLATVFYEIAPNSAVWQKLADQSIVRKNVIVANQMYFDAFLPDEPLADDAEHETSSPVPVTDVAFISRSRVGIMERVRNSRSRAQLFWRFLTEWLVVHDSGGLNIKEADCGCGKAHSYFRAAWLVPLARNSWVPLGNDRRDRATASSLANLLRDSDALPIPDSDAVNGLLNAIRISRFDLTRESMYNDDETRDVVDNKLMNIMAVVQDSPDRLDAVPSFLKQLKEDEGLVRYIEERRKDRETMRRRQNLGYLVEDLVRKNLEAEGFSVARTGVGSDFEIKHNADMVADTSDVLNLKVTLDHRSWLIEVKATREDDVRMSHAQADEAAKQGDRFLLCVVPVETDRDPVLEDVRMNMRFVEGMGERVRALCDELNGLENKRNEINGEYSDGVQLEVMSGNARVSVSSSVWEVYGFCLSELPKRLK